MELKTMSQEEFNRLQYHIEECLKILKVSDTPGTERTPYRIAKMWAEEVFANRNRNNIDELNNSIALFDNNQGQNLIVMDKIPFSSMCEHHFMPFMGTVTLGYVPNNEIIGLSKIPRIVKYFSKRPQLQERLTDDIATYFYKAVKPIAVFVYIKAEHTCVSCRGIESAGNVTETYTSMGRDENAEREFKERMMRS